jgi:uncharacterized membrane protein YphA (DoxX/SURF4 family)
MSERGTSTPVKLAMLAARVVIVAGLIPNGLRKLAGFEQLALAMGGQPQIIGGRPFPPAEIEPLVHFPVPQFFLAGSIVLDLLGALLVIVGFRARAAAGVLVAYCLTAMTIYHYDFTVAENLHSVIRTAPMFGGLLYVAAVGAGDWSIDHWLRQRRGPVPGAGLPRSSHPQQGVQAS